MVFLAIFVENSILKLDVLRLFLNCFRMFN